MSRFPNMLTISLLCVMCTGVLPVDGQTSPGPQLLFGITRNSENGRTTLWRFDIAENRATALLRLGAVNPATPRQLFPQSEREALDAAVARGSYTRGDSDTPGVSQDIARVWQLDTFTLLILQQFDVCQRPLEGCYGFYHFGLLDLASGEITRLLDFPYTHAGTDTWDGCPEGVRIWIEDVLPNPQRRVIAFTVRPRVRCITWSMSRSTTLLMALAPPADNAPPTSVAATSHVSGQPRAATTMAGTVVTSSNSMIRGFVSST